MAKKVCCFIFVFFIFIINIILYLNISNYIRILNICFNNSIVLTNNLYTLICSIIAFISIFIVIDILLVLFKKTKGNKGIKIKKEDGTHGTANWMQENEMLQVLGTNDTPGIILGRLNRNIIKLPFASYFNKNICVFGSSGSMKTTSFLLTNLLELSIYKKSIIVTDPKRRNL